VILELLQPDPSLLEGVTVLLRGATHAAVLGAAGLGLFLAGFAHRLDAEGLAHARRWLLGAALLGIALSLLGLALRVAVLSGGGAWDAATWQAVMTSRIGDAFWIRLAGLALLGFAAAPWRAAPALAGMGALAAAASFAAMGHSTLFRPRQELAALVTLHLLALAFWMGSLPPLARAAARADAALIRDWSRAGVVAVVVLAATGGVLAALLLRSPASLAGSWYGWALIAKLLLVVALVGLALRHRLALTPALAEGVPGAGARLARSIRIEMIVAVLVFWAAAELVSVHPPDLGHRAAP
jgi:putative copper export protein